MSTGAPLSRPEADRRVPVLVNIAGGTAASLGREACLDRIRAAFAAAGLPVAVEGVAGRAIAPALRRAARSAATVVVAGGDGTVGTAAQIIAGSGVRLGILPLGTLNHFARDLGLPLDIEGAARVIARGEVRRVDVGEVNGRVFVNNASLGLYPRMVRDRERQRRRYARHKWLAMAIAFLKVLRRPPVRRLRIAAGGWTAPRRTPFAFVGNNEYATDLLRLGRRPRLDGGRLFLYVARATTVAGVLGLLLRLAIGRIDGARDLERFEVPALTIDTRRRRLAVALDGEVRRLKPPLRFRSRPGELLVLAPAAGEEAR